MGKAQRILAFLLCLLMCLGVILASGFVLNKLNPIPVPTPTISAAPTPGPPPILGHCNNAIFSGYIFVEEGNGIDKLNCTDAGIVQDQAITGSETSNMDLFSATISPDGRFLRYGLVSVNGDHALKVVSLNVQTGAKQMHQLSGDSGSGNCLSWSPDGTQVSYVANGGLILANLTTGTQKVLAQEPSANYTNIGLAFGRIDCGTWISDDALLFHRYIGSMPDSITIPGNQLDPNTTTLALLQNKTLVDTSGASWTISAVSDDGMYVLLADIVNTKNWALVPASTFTSFAAPQPISSCTGCTLIGFVPHSDEVYGFQSDPDSSLYKRLVFMNPPGIRVQLGPTGLPAGVSLTPNATNLVVIQQEGTPTDAIVLYEYQESGKDYYAITNLHSGEVNWLINQSGPLIGWVL